MQLVGEPFNPYKIAMDEPVLSAIWLYLAYNQIPDLWLMRAGIKTIVRLVREGQTKTRQFFEMIGKM